MIYIQNSLYIFIIYIANSQYIDSNDEYKGLKSTDNKPYPSPNDNQSLSDANKGNTGNDSNQTTTASSPKSNNRLQLNEKSPLDGFKKLYTESDEVIKKTINKILTNDVDVQKLQNSTQNDYNSQLLNDPDNNLLDQLTDSDAMSLTPSQPISIEQENMRKYFEMLTVEQQQLLKSKLPLLSDITTLDKRNEILIKKLLLCATTFDFLTTVKYDIYSIYSINMRYCAQMMNMTL